MPFLPVKETAGAAISTTVVVRARIRYLEAGSEGTVKIPFPHVAMTQVKHLPERVYHRIFFPRQFCKFYSVAHWNHLPVLGCRACSRLSNLFHFMFHSLHDGFNNAGVSFLR